MGRKTLAATRSGRLTLYIVACLAALGGAAVSFWGGLQADAQGGGGTAKPPPDAVSPWIVPTLPTPNFATDPAAIHGFDMTGFLQTATVSADNSRCPNTTDPARFGGTVTINNAAITIPCNMVVQMPANTFRWADFVNSGPSLALGSGTPSFEMSVVGNTVAGENIAALMYFSQQSLNAGSGVIQSIDYATGNILVESGDPANPAVVQINDPNGRFGRPQSPDPRLSVDDENPTIHAATGYPMCVPRTVDAGGESTDALCPQLNRPRVTNGQCRNFGAAGIPLPVSGELSLPAAGQIFCSQFVMPAPATRAPGDPDSRQQAPFEVGDFISYSGSLFTDGGGNDYISAHTIEANVGIYTQPGTQPSYLAIGEFGIGSADPNPVAVNGAGQESQDRIFLEAETTDVQTAVDIYYLNPDPQTGVVKDSWITPFEMTGEPGGGITTQFAGPQPQRARLRATKAPVGLLSQPPRMVRVAVRSLCAPQQQQDQTATDACFAQASQPDMLVANGLAAGQYAAPVFEYIFPENVKPGDPVVPYDFWHLPFLRYGEGAATAEGVGPLEPSPWGAELAAPPVAPAGNNPPPVVPPAAAPAAPAAAVVPPAAPVPPPAIAGLRFLPPATAGARVSIVASLNAPAKVVTLTIANAGGTVVKKLTLTYRRKGKVTFRWNGRNGAGRLVPKGTYTVRVTAKTGTRVKTILVRGLRIV